MAEVKSTGHNVDDVLFKMIDLSYSNGAIYVWNVEDVQKLRMTYRIIGNFVGCLSALPRQDQLLGLPMQLTNEEANLLVSKKLARMVKYDELDHPINCENAEQRKKMHKQSYLEQAILFREERKKQILSVADKIIEGKRKKKGGEKVFDKQSAVNEELEKIAEMTEDAMMVQIFTRPHWELNGKTLKRPIIKSTRCAVFTDLWERGYYLTGGEKFGGDFLVYPADPVKFHSHYIVVCVEENHLLDSQFMVSKGRLGTSVKKTVLLSFVNSAGLVVHQSLQWDSI